MYTATSKGYLDTARLLLEKVTRAILATGILLVSNTAFAQDTIRIATWNIEHLGSPGRGLGGIGGGSLPLRSEAQLKQIARLIRDDLRVDLLAIQEVAITGISGSLRVSNPLEIIIEELGEDWSYHIGNPGGEIQLGSIHNMQNAFLWNAAKVRPVRLLDLTFPNALVGPKHLFDRVPLVGYFQALKNNRDTNDFLLVNVHLTSGQNNDENHLAAMVIIEQNIRNLLRQQNIKESDRIILGDFNDNPFAKTEGGEPRFIDLLYRYMETRRYRDFVTEEIGFTRLNADKTSIIDHILINNSIASRHLVGSVEKFLPEDSSNQGLARWRRTFSDHLPLILTLRVADEDDDVD